MEGDILGREEMSKFKIIIAIGGKKKIAIER